MGIKYRPKPTISVIVPVYCEESIIELCHKRIAAVLAKLADFQHEIVFVDDGSEDRSLEELKRIAGQDAHVKVVSFSRNFGHQIAITAGLLKACGDVVVIIDADLQDPPELIPDMVRLWRKGYDVVYGKRKEREGETFFKRMSAAIYYRVLNYLSEHEIPRDVGDFRLIDRKVVDEINKMKEPNRFLRGLISWVGFRQIAIEYDRVPRASGESKYPLRKMIRFGVNGIISFSSKPLRMSLNLGFFSIIISFAILLYSLFMHFSGNTIRGWTSTIIVILFMGGIQLFTLGIIGEYLVGIFEGIKGRPLFIINEEVNFPDSSQDDECN